MFLSKELISAQSEQILKYHLRSGLDSTSSFRTPMFLTTELISAQSAEQIKKIFMSEVDEIQAVASEHTCFLVKN